MGVCQDRRDCVKLVAHVGSLWCLPVFLQGSFSTGSGDPWCSTSYNMQIKSHFIFPKGLMSLGHTIGIPILPHYPWAVPRSLSKLPISPASRGTADLVCLQLPSDRDSRGVVLPGSSIQNIPCICSCQEWPMGNAWTAAACPVQQFFAEGFSQNSSLGSLERELTSRLWVLEHAFYRTS